MKMQFFIFVSDLHDMQVHIYCIVFIDAVYKSSVHVPAHVQSLTGKLSFWGKGERKLGNVILFWQHALLYVWVFNVCKPTGLHYAKPDHG